MRPAALDTRFVVSRESWDRLERFVELLLIWQARINLIAPSTIPDVWERHVADSLQLLPLLPKTTRHIADLGSGGGFPGIVLAIATDAAVHFYESNGKKCAFLREALRVTGSTGVVHQQRLESLHGQPGLSQVDVVTARAFAPLDQLLSHAEPFLKHGAIGLFHKGQKLEDELTMAAKYWRLQSVQHPSVIDSDSFVLEIKEITRVQS